MSEESPESYLIDVKALLSICSILGSLGDVAIKCLESQLHLQ